MTEPCCPRCGVSLEQITIIDQDGQAWYVFWRPHLQAWSWIEHARELRKPLQRLICIGCGETLYDGRVWACTKPDGERGLRVLLYPSADALMEALL